MIEHGDINGYSKKGLIRKIKYVVCLFSHIKLIANPCESLQRCLNTACDVKNGPPLLPIIFLREGREIVA